MATGKSWVISVPITKEGGTWGYIKVHFQEEYDAVNNYSTLKVTKMTGSNTIRSGGFYTNGSISIDGTKWYSWNTGNWVFSGLVGDDEFSTYSGAKYPSGLRIDHNADGNKTITVAVNVSYYYGYDAGWSGTGGTVSQSVALTPIPRASSVTASNGTIGTALNINVTKANSAFTHTIKYSFGSASGTIVSKTSNTSITWAPPMELCSQIPKAKSDTCTITCETYNGSTLVGTKTTTMTLTVPMSVGLTVADGWANVSPYNNGTEAAAMAAYVQGYSRAAVAFDATKISTANAYGATIASYRIIFNGKTYTDPYHTDVLNTAGEVTITATVIDSRGYAVNEDFIINVEAYVKPILSNIKIFRCNSYGVETDEGTYLSVTAKANISSVAGLNVPVIQLTIGNLMTVDIPDDETVIVGDGLVLSVLTYQVVLRLTDCLGNTGIYTQAIPTAEAFFHGRKGGRGAAFGKYAEEDDLLDVDWNIRGRKNLTARNIGISTYYNPTQFGSSYDATIADLYSALPANSIFMCEAGALTDASWKFPSTYGTVVILKRGTARSKTIFYGKDKGNGNYYSNVENSGVPNGEWVNFALDAYPVGSIYMSVNSTSPASRFGGTWAQLKDRFLLGAGSSYSNGATGGAATHTLTVNEMPSHNHVVKRDNGNIGINGGTGSGTAFEWASNSIYPNSILTTNTGGSAAHNNMPPYLVVYMWKRTA